MSILPLRTADQFERMTLETLVLATRNKQSIIFQYDMICQTKDCKNWYFSFSNKHVALGRKNSQISVFQFNLIYITWGRFLLLSIRKNFNLMKVTFRHMPGMTIFLLILIFYNFFLILIFYNFSFSFYLV